MDFKAQSAATSSDASNMQSKLDLKKSELDKAADSYFRAALGLISFEEHKQLKQQSKLRRQRATANPKFVTRADQPRKKIQTRRNGKAKETQQQQQQRGLSENATELHSTAKRGSVRSLSSAHSVSPATSDQAASPTPNSPLESDAATSHKFSVPFPSVPVFTDDDVTREAEMQRAVEKNLCRRLAMKGRQWLFMH